MIFDLACRLAERQVPWLVPFLREAALFMMPANPHEFLPKNPEPDEIEFFEANFCLPFRFTAVEDNASLVLLMDIEEGAMGANIDRRFVEVLPMNSSPTAFRTTEQSYLSTIQKLGEIPPESAVISRGHVKVVHQDTGGILYSGSVDEVVLATPDQVVHREERITDRNILAPALRNAGTCWQEIMFINNPARFVVEVTSRGSRKPQKNPGHIRRAHERPKYTLLDLRELRKVLGVPEPTGRHPVAHRRRRHFRRLVDDRFVNKKGQVVVVREAWIGPEEATVGNRRYKVLLDR